MLCVEGVVCEGCGVWRVWCVECVMHAGREEEGITTTAVTTIKMEELVEMAQLVEEEENKEEENQEDNRGFFQWQDTLIKKVHVLYKKYDTLVFLSSLAE